VVACGPEFYKTLLCFLETLYETNVISPETSARALTWTKEIMNKHKKNMAAGHYLSLLLAAIRCKNPERAETNILNIDQARFLKNEAGNDFLGMVRTSPSTPKGFGIFCKSMYFLKKKFF
jgi:hypothetical protein